MSLETRTLVQQGRTVSVHGLGCMGMSQSYGPANERESIATIHRAIELGCTLLDTAEVYGNHANEELLGRALKGRRDAVTLATKFGFNLGPNGERLGGMNSQPDHIREVVDASLRRLQTDHIDVLYQHRVDPVVPIEEVAGTVGELVQAGWERGDTSAFTLDFDSLQTRECKIDGFAFTLPPSSFTRWHQHALDTPMQA
jgi:aryl-alcohol dehydrogenase-like predicted oxidoreductase